MSRTQCFDSPEPVRSAQRGDLIDYDRLDTLPHARYCMNCKLKEEADAA
jgi:hypothetical protein